jgi:3-oxoacyl-[acyl-carrier protein] reductase
MGTGLLAGDTALVTGAASGIGRSIALALAAEGARLVISDVDGAGGRETEAAIAATGAKARFIAADLAQSDAAGQLFDAAKAELGTVSVFVHSACPRRMEAQTALEVTAEEWDRMLNVNLRSGFLLGRAAGVQMKAKGIKGRMLYITSLHADSPRNLPHYSASKAGQTMVMKELARALSPHGIRINAIAPGAIPGGGFSANVEQLNRQIAMGRTGTPQEVAGMAVALLAERFSAYVTGTTVVVDGGLALYNWIAPSAAAE